MSEFRINEHLSVRLEEGKTIIYVDNERFSQCKFLLLNIRVDEIKSLDKIQSIDEASERLDNSLETNQEKSGKPIQIPPEVEFWGHSSNLQVWAENRYDTRLLHRNLAFPLLKKLTEAGDFLAKVVLKEEIVKRLSSGNRAVNQFLMNKGYIDMLEEEELEIYFFSMPRLFKEFFINLNNGEEELREEYNYDLYHLLKILSKTDYLLDKLIMDREINIIRCLIMIAALTHVDGETIELILVLFKKLSNSSKEVSEILEEEISYQFNKGSPKILLELIYDNLFRLLTNSSVITLFTNETFIENLLFLIEDPRHIIDSLIEFFKKVYDDIDEEYISKLLILMSDDTKARFKEQLKERLKDYSTRKDIYWENKEELIQMAYILLELLNK